MMFRTILALAAPFLLAAPAAAASYDRVYVFGDSLVDSGNAQKGATTLFNMPDPAPATEGNYEGRFSNGPNFADQLSGLTGHGEATAYLNGGTNYAVGGATAVTFAPGQAPTQQDALIPSLTQQIGLYVASLTGSTPAGFPKDTRPAIDANSLVVITIGGNDVRDFLQYGTPDLTPPITADTPTVKALSSALTTLEGLGAANIVVVGLPDIGKIPSVLAAGPVASGFGTGLSLMLNSAYEDAVATADAALPGAGSVQYFDLFGLQTAAETNPTAYGLDPALLTTSCKADNAQASNCAGYLFFDGIHPTTQVHSLIANAIATQLGVTPVPEPATWAMLVLGFGAIGAGLRGRRREQALA